MPLMELDGEQREVPAGMVAEMSAIGARVVSAPASPTAEGGGSRRSGRGRTATPEDMQAQGFVAKAKDLITGESQQTATTQGASDITMSPEWNAIQTSGLAGQMQPEMGGVDTLKRTALRTADALTGGLAGSVKQAGAMAASPQEQFQMILAANPGIQPETDEKGNRFFRSENGQVYSEQPGLNLTDIPRIAANAAPFVATGGQSGILAAAGAAAATQGVLEAGQAAAGGEFSPGEVALAGGLGGAGALAGRAAAGVKNAIRPAAQEVAEDVTQAATKTVAADAMKGAPVDDVALAKIATRAADGNPAAVQQLAELMAVDEGAAAAAKRLGIDLPADVLSESEQIKAVFGGVRGKVGSEAEGAWSRTVKEAADKADEVVQQFDGAASPAAVSDKVLGSLNGSRDALKAEAKVLYDAVDAVIQPSARVTMDNVSEVVSKSLKDLAGDAGALSDGERRLLRLAEKAQQEGTEGVATHEAMRRVKSDLQRAIRMGDGPFAGNDIRRLKVLERALKADELANAERLGGAEVRAQVRAAHQMTAKQKALEERIVGAFGRDKEGSAAALIQGAIADASKGNGARLAKLLKVVPEELRGEVLMTGLSSSTRAKGGVAAGGFGFAEFAKTYAGLRQKGNEAIYGQIAKELGPERAGALRDLFEISKRVTEARAAIKQTGKANQPFMQALEAEGLIERLAGNPVVKSAAVGAGAGAGGGLGAIGANALLNFLAKGDKEVVQRLGKLLISPEFSALAIEMSTKPQASSATVKRAVRSKAWQAFAKAAKLPRDPTEAEKWLMALVQGAKTTRNP